MAWESEDSRHEGYIEYVFADGFAGSGWSVDGVMVTTNPDGSPIPYGDRPASRPPAGIVGWRVACNCDGRRGAWRGELWSRGETSDVKRRILAVPDDQVDDIDGLPAGRLLHDQWVRHLGPAFAELVDVRAAAAAVELARDGLNAAVAAARAAGASWEAVGDAAGITRQSAHERWGTR
ncbi:MAG TPA: hypothetical protein VGL05_30280 [Kribbella sp.]